MKLFLLCTLLFVCAFAAEESNVVVLDESNFDETIQSNQFVLVEFYAPWCGHCKALAPEYEKAANNLKENADIVIAKVDATVENQLAQRFGIRGYPTLKFFKNGVASEYTGPRQSPGIENWVLKKSGPPSKQVSSVEEALQQLSKPLVVGSFNGQRDSDSYKQFIEAANEPSLDEFTFADVSGSQEDSVVLYTTFSDPQTFDGQGSLKDFVLNKGYPLVDEIPNAYARYSAKGYPLAIAFVDHDVDNSKLLETLNEAAKAVEGKFSFSVADGKRFKQHLEGMGANSDLPSIAAMKLDKKGNYPFAQEITVENLVAFANGIVDGSVEPTKKSEEIPEKNDEPVTVVVGKNFESIVMDTTKDVLLEIYAPWCGHCKNLAPVYEDLGKAFANDANVVIAKVDGTANDIDVEFSGFPTIKFFPAGEGASMIDYNSGRDLESFKKFINDHRKSSPAGETGKDEL